MNPTIYIIYIVILNTTNLYKNIPKKKHATVILTNELQYSTLCEKKKKLFSAR